MAVQVSAESGFTTSTPVAVLGANVNATLQSGLQSGFVDASRDGREFLIARPVTSTAPRAPVSVLLDWSPMESRHRAPCSFATEAIRRPGLSGSTMSSRHKESTSTPRCLEPFTVRSSMDC